MLLLMIFLICLFVAVGAGLLAAWSDFKGLTIPNIYSVIIGGAFLASYAVLWIFGRDDVFFSFSSHFLSALIIFAITAIMFAVRGIGAADSKLGTVYALWAGIPGLPAYLFYTSVFGGILGLMALFCGKWKPFKNPPAGSWIARVQNGESKVPYGIAIVLGALASFIHLGYIDTEVLSSFLLS